MTFQHSGVVAVALLALCACRQDMHDQPRYKPLAETDFFGDGRAARPVPQGTIAQGELRLDAARYTGKQGTENVNAFPIPISRADVMRGRSRFEIFCSPCHGRVGDGAGMIVRRGFRPAGNYHEERLLRAPVGHFFDVITNGYGAMPSYASRVDADDRWRIIAYIRVLQLSQNSTLGDVPPERRQELESAE